MSLRGDTEIEHRHSLPILNDNDNLISSYFLILIVPVIEISEFT